MFSIKDKTRISTLSKLVLTNAGIVCHPRFWQARNLLWPIINSYLSSLDSTVIGFSKPFSLILLAKSSNNIVCGNIISGKTDNRSGALYISHDSFNNIVFQNAFENNALAIALGAQVATTVWNNVYDNRFYKNDFLNNTQNVWIAPGAPVNYWDNGQQGNYWSNFHGVDSNGDGLSEIPYEITANNTDHHPLMNPIDISTLVLPSTSTTPSTSSSPNQNTSSSSSPDTTNKPAVPEFETWIIILVIMAVTLVPVAVYKRKHHR